MVKQNKTKQNDKDTIESATPNKYCHCSYEDQEQEV
jgi:hypothetical protein